MVVQWTLTDNSTGTPDVFTFPINPNTFEPPNRRARVTPEYSSAGSGSRILFQGQDETPRGSFGGVINAQVQHEDMVLWGAKWYPLVLADDLGNTWNILITDYKETRLNRHLYPHRYDYTIEFLVI
jgi:hypothetical protein